MWGMDSGFPMINVLINYLAKLTDWFWLNGWFIFCFLIWSCMKTMSQYLPDTISPLLKQRNGDTAVLYTTTGIFWGNQCGFTFYQLLCHDYLTKETRLSTSCLTQSGGSHLTITLPSLVQVQDIWRHQNKILHSHPKSENLHSISFWLDGVYCLAAIIRVDSRLAPSQWETPLQSNAVSHWLGANLESVLIIISHQPWHISYQNELTHDSLNLVLWLHK